VDAKFRWYKSMASSANRRKSESSMDAVEESDEEEANNLIDSLVLINRLYLRHGSDGLSASEPERSAGIPTDFCSAALGSVGAPTVLVLENADGVVPRALLLVEGIPHAALTDTDC